MKKLFLTAVIVVVILLTGVLTVNVGQNAVVYNSLSKRERVLAPGIYFTLPFIEQTTYIYMTNRSSVVVLPVKFIDGGNATVSMLVVWHVTSPAVYLDVVNHGHNSVEQGLTAIVTQVVQSYATRASLAVFNGMQILAVDPATTNNLGVSLDSITINTIVQPVVNNTARGDTPQAESQQMVMPTMVAAAPSNVVNGSSIVATPDRLMIESAYYSAQKIKTATEIQEAALYNQIKVKDQKFYNYFRLIDVYRNSASSKAEVPPLEKLYR